VNAILAVIDQLLSFSPFLIFALPLALFGYFMAQEKKWAYWAAVVFSILNVLSHLDYLIRVFNFGWLFSAIFSAALVALLLHDQSRSYVKIYFR
jgi:uncharacterized membrane-anchored protein